MKKILTLLFITLTLLGIGFFAWMYFSPEKQRDIWTFVPDDAIYVVESQNPIKDWNRFSHSAVWKYLNGVETMAEINESATYLDSLLQANKTLLQAVGERQMLISAHMQNRVDYDYLYLIDLKKGAKITVFTDLVLGVLKSADINYSTREVEGREILEIIDSDNESIYLSFVDNILICSYSQKTIRKAIEQSEKPFFPSTEKFTAIQSKTKSEGPFQFFMNFNRMSNYLELYLDDVPYDLVESMGFLGLDIRITDSEVDLEGSMNVDDAHTSLLNVMLEVKPARLKAEKVLSSGTSFTMNLGFDDFSHFLSQVEKDLKLDPEAWKEYEDSRKKVEKFLGISFEEHLFSWIGEEITLGLLPPAPGSADQSYLALFHTNDSKNAREKMDFVSTRIKKKTPVKFKKEDYKGYEVNYMEMKGFFKLIFGKLFNKFEKPHYIIMDDFVIFSNDTVVLHRLINDFEGGQTLAKLPEYQKFRDNFSSKSNVFVYANTPNIYPLLPSLADPGSRSDIRKNKKYLLAFPQVGFQLNSEDDHFEIEAFMEFSPNEKNQP